MATPDLTHHDLERHLDKLDGKIELLHAELSEIKVLLATATSAHRERLDYHQREISNAHRRVGRLEDRQWQTAGAVALGALSFIGTLSLFVLTFLL